MDCVDVLYWNKILISIFLVFDVIITIFFSVRISILPTKTQYFLKFAPSYDFILSFFLFNRQYVTFL